MKRIVLVVAAVLLVGAVFVFEPWTAFTSTTVDEAAPTISAPASSTSPVETAPKEIARGSFVSQEHDTSGAVRIIESPDGSLTLRLEGFETSNGPDLHVWLSDRGAGGDWFKYDDGRFIELGELKGNKGNHNYAIPPGADLTDIKSVVIWCKRFRVSFGSAAIDA